MCPPFALYNHYITAVTPRKKKGTRARKGYTSTKQAVVASGTLLHVLETVVGELVVTGHDDQSPPGWSQGVEHLHTCLDPHLEQRSNQ